MAECYFTQASLDFLSQLSKNNNREWFADHKQQYEDVVRTPALSFISDMSDEIMMLSPHFRAIAKKVGGSLMRIHRDVRFTKDKIPYKTNIGIQFRHHLGKDVHAPGFYLHVEPQECFVGVGIWRPDSASLGKIRDAIIDNEKSWIAASQDKAFTKRFRYTGEALVNAPRGYSKEHPQLEDIKRKDFIAICDLTEKTVCSSKLMSQVVERYQTASPYMEFLCRALDLNY